MNAFRAGEYGRLGHGSPMDEMSPRRVHIPTKHRIVDARAGDAHSLALDVRGTCWAFGW